MAYATLWCYVLNICTLISVVARRNEALVCVIFCAVDSMEECDALCTRIAIMVNGQLQCLGSPQHLKSKYGDGYTLIAKVGSDAPGLDVNVSPICQHVEHVFPGSALKDVHHGLVQFHIPRSPSVSFAALFSAMEKVRDELSVEDYSISQTTLEQVFINFARNQHPPSDVGYTRCCQSICCCISLCASAN